MAKPCSIDLRERVVAAIEEEGLSRHKSTARFGVGVSTAIRGAQLYRETGSVAPGQINGHDPIAIRAEHRAWMLERTREQDFSLRSLGACLSIGEIFVASCFDI